MAAPPLFAPPQAFGVLGLIEFAYSQFLGNGKDTAKIWPMTPSSALAAGPSLLALFALRPLVTALCLGSGASGGLFTPAPSTGAVLGGAAGIAWSLAWPGSPSGAYALIGAAAMLGAALQAPLADSALTLGLTHGGFQIMIPMIATVTAAVIARRIDGYSICTARLRARPSQPGDPPPESRASRAFSPKSAPGTGHSWLSSPTSGLVTAGQPCLT